MYAKEAITVKEMLCGQIETRVNKQVETSTGRNNGGSGELPAAKRCLLEAQL